MTTSQKQNLILIADELKRLEPQIKQNFSRLSSLASDLLDQNQFKSVKILKWDPASKYCASVTNGIFKQLENCANTRASDVMSTQSPTDFEWSVKCFGSGFRVGIASQLKSEN